MSDLPTVAQRFLRYVRYDTQSEDGAETYPSTEKQKVLLQLLVDELKELGCQDVAMDAYGYVTATVPGNVQHEVPVIGLLSHVDTSPEVSGEGVNPQLHPNYDGGPIRISDQLSLTPEQCPNLRQNLGNTIITTDGETLLGADNKSGIAEIMTMVERLTADPSIKHGKLRIAFTPDEEIGAGTQYFDVKAFGAKYAYTVDGESPGEVENETFCADSVVVTVTGINVHPGYAKDKLVSAIRAASLFVQLLPKDMAPETTEKREGYIHPIGMSGGVEQVTLKMILRDFDQQPLREQRDILADIAQKVQAVYPGVELHFEYSESYRNMRFVLDEHPDVVNFALEAVKRAGLEPCLNLIRGGTDGARLCFMGLPTPNIFTGGHLFHSRSEWIAIEAMEQAVETLVQLVQVWSEKSA